MFLFEQSPAYLEGQLVYHVDLSYQYLWVKTFQDSLIKCVKCNKLDKWGCMLILQLGAW